jgi:hypothetical protein
MTEPSFTPKQVGILEKLVRAGFTFVTLERYARYLAVEKNGFVALLDPAGGKLALFSQVGYRMGEGIGMLLENPKGKAFVYHQQSIPATEELLTAYDRFKRELSDLLHPMEGRV